MTTYVNRYTGDVIDTMIDPGPKWSALEKFRDTDGKDKLRFELDGAMVVLEEVGDGNTGTE